MSMRTGLVQSFSAFYPIAAYPGVCDGGLAERIYRRPCGVCPRETLQHNIPPPRAAGPIIHFILLSLDRFSDARTVFSRRGEDLATAPPPSKAGRRERPSSWRESSEQEGGSHFH